MATGTCVLIRCEVCCILDDAWENKPLKLLPAWTEPTCIALPTLPGIDSTPDPVEPGSSLNDVAAGSGIVLLPPVLLPVARPLPADVGATRQSGWPETAPIAACLEALPSCKWQALLLAQYEK